MVFIGVLVVLWGSAHLILFVRIIVLFVVDLGVFC